MLLDAIPIWVLFVATFILVLAAIELGYRVGHAMHRRSEEEKESPVSAIASTILGLAAFMLAFTFGIVSERYDSKKALVRDDAIAIHTAWQRADFLPDSDRPEAKALLARYVELRVEFAEKRDLRPETLRQVTAESHQIQNRLWDMAVANARLDMNSDVAAMYIDALNDVNSVHATRVAIGIQARVPIEIWITLYLITILGLIAVGYQTGIAGSKRSMVRPVLALSIALVFSLIATLDRPDSGIMAVSQRPLIELRERMGAKPDPPRPTDSAARPLTRRVEGPAGRE